MLANVEIVNDKTVLVLPADAAARLNLNGGSQVNLVDSPNGLEIVADPERARQLEIARGVMREDHEALSELAK